MGRRGQPPLESLARSDEIGGTLCELRREEIQQHRHCQGAVASAVQEEDRVNSAPRISNNSRGKHDLPNINFASVMHDERAIGLLQRQQEAIETGTG